MAKSFNECTWGEFKLGELFNVATPKKKFNANSVLIGAKGHPYVVRSSANNGIRGYIEEDEQFLNAGGTFSFGQDTATVFWQEKPYFTGDKIKVLFPKFDCNEEIALFMLERVAAPFKLFAWGSQSFSEDVIKNVTLYLPITPSGEIDWGYMQERIAELEQERIAELEQYLIASGLNDYKLTDEDKDVLAEFESKDMGEFKIGELFNKADSRWEANRKFSKRLDTSTTPNKEYDLPLVNAKHGDNGIMFYGRSSDFTSTENSICVVKNGAIATGDVYPEPQKTGVLWDAYLVKLNDRELSVELAEFLACSLEKSIKLKFNYSDKAGWDKVKKEVVSLPVTASGEPDYDFMERYIKAIQKLVIADVVKYKDEMIEKTKECVTSA